MINQVVTIEDWRTAQAGTGGLARLQSLAEDERRLNSCAWIAVATEDQIFTQWNELQALNRTDLPLWGVPFAVKDNIDVAGFPTTAACPAFSRSPAERDAQVVAHLKAAGAIVIGKTNLDQFATGLVGTRSPYGAVPNTFDPSRVSGGSSSGSGTVVGRGVVPFALGTDTAGSGRVPAGFNNVLGLKPTPGALSTTGVVPACRTLDCVSIFALTVADASLVLSVAEGLDLDDAYSKKRPEKAATVPRQRPTVAICSNPPWFGDDKQQDAYSTALDGMRAQDWQLTPTDFGLLFALARLLYEGPWVAERYQAIRDFIESAEPEMMDPTVRSIILKARNFSAADTFAAEYKRQELVRAIETAFESYDFLLVPTTPTFPTHADIARDPVGANSNLGTYTNFVNFLGWSALSIPAGFRTDGLPFGLTLIAKPWQEFALLQWATQFLSRAPRLLGATKVEFQEPRQLATGSQADGTAQPPNLVSIAVVGAHLSGLPLNKDLTTRQGILKVTTRTSANYRFFALPPQNGIRKPGLKRVSLEEQGEKIEAEVWALPSENLASFIATIPHPLGIGSVELEDGSWSLGFICEPVGLADAQDITSYGGWRCFLADQSGLTTKNDVVELDQHTHSLYTTDETYTTSGSGTPDDCQSTDGSDTTISSRVHKPIGKVLIANRGEIALRIIKTLRRMKIATVSVYSDADIKAPHVKEADEALALGGGAVSNTYLNGSKIVECALSVGADAVIPGYGFLSENAEFAHAVEHAGLVWIGPTPEQMRTLGLKHEARDVALRAGVPVVPGSGRILSSVEDAVASAEELGYPIMLKSTAGGGGIGIKRCDNVDMIKEGFESVRQLSEKNFGNSGIFLERFVCRARHIEVQVIGDGAGNVVTIGERDCSLQRRHQKLLEESPAFNLPDDVRARLLAAAHDLAAAVKYRNVGTVEFIYDSDTHDFYFLEVNTRLQVEHPVTESVSGLDLVECMIQVASGEGLTDLFSKSQHLFSKSQSFAHPISGASVEARIYAESPLQHFRPSTGTILDLQFPSNARVDTWVSKGTEITSLYDPMIAKVIVNGRDRAEAVQKLANALTETRIVGVETNIDYLHHLLTREWFISGQYATNTLETVDYTCSAVEVVEAGPSSTIQDYPGRLGLWHAGIPPSGPIDDYSARLANYAVGNTEEAPVLEATFDGPTMLFHADTVVAVTGATGQIQINDKMAAMNEPLRVSKNDVLKVGRAVTGYRFYIAVLGGFHVPSVLGSRSTFELGKFGGHNGRKLQKGDIIRLGQFIDSQATAKSISPALIPSGTSPLWNIGVVPGPHGSPDYFTPDGVSTLFNDTWSVHHNINRLGIRLSGPLPKWARENGGEAGLHPSNIHDAPYSIGSVSFTGDEAIILACDGPSLGGFVVFCVVASSELWKLGQLKPGDRVKFEPMSAAQAASLATQTEQKLVESTNGIEIRKTNGENAINSMSSAHGTDVVTNGIDLTASPVFGSFRRGETTVSVRQAGDHCMLLEFGEVDGFDLAQSFTIWGFVEQHNKVPILGVEQLSPGVRTLHVDYEKGVSPKTIFDRLESHLFEVPRQLLSRKFRLPLAVDDLLCQEAVQRYAATIRSDAPLLPSNIKFLEQLNELEEGSVERLMYEAEFLVLGLGDVFLGSPCAVPMDPRHRLYGTKYNPSRSTTPRGAVGIGGQYMCIYGGTSPGGYQLVGRTIDVWDNTALQHTAEKLPRPNESLDELCKFRMFDRISFYPVPESQLDQLDAETMVFMEEDVLSLDEYQAWLLENESSIDKTSASRKAAFQNTRFLEQLLQPPPKAGATPADDSASRTAVVDGVLVVAEMHGRCFRVGVKEGDEVKAGDAVIWIESNKMEIAIASPATGTVALVEKTEGNMVEPGDVLVVIS
ncbi:urea amidolyase [Cordyceps fumosorosea ARSEF 2679]|uniref:Urea amidolyase n=1 Tax=Cordyceps fumosorosea (strain ARSEF 2679) TaxID=1081104 RepID=A0A168BSG5_CORFA|nr:urea amidolyase [Cordyceps fumosorosea ARSEF 2679]OAA70490.1 urea amidolyase [Cordyceps fumosorosea ARSEF 2679]